MMSCASCRSALPPGARFCPQCAAPVASGEPVPADSLEAALGARYGLVRLLGRGGMGAVYLGRETALDREVAIKVLPSERGEGQDLERFRREARTAARLMHPNIVPLHGWGEVGSTPYFVMGYVRGEPLSARMRRGLAPEAARRILVDLADALDYAHRQGVVHRDIKPDNVLIDDDSGRPMLTDFGVAKAKGAGHTLTTAGSVVGTPHYMSPEQAAGKDEIDGRSDIYSLGVMGYAMLAGRLPFEGKSAADVLVQHMTKAPPPLRPLVPPEVADALVAVIERCLEKDPAARWADARELRDTLASAGDEGEDVPDELADVTGWGLVLAALGLAAAYAALYRSYAPESGWPIDPRYPLLAAAGIALVMGNRVRESGGFRLRASAVLRALFLQPMWWLAWYPRPWRRRGDVFDRLPSPYRAQKTVLALLFPLYVLWLIPTIVVAMATNFGAASPANERALWGVMLLLVLALGSQVVRAERWARRRGVGNVERSRLLWASTSKRGVWTRPQLARLLSAPGEAALRTPQTPEACLRALAAVVAGLTGPARDAVSEAVATGGRLRAAIEALDRELSDLARDSDPAEAFRLRARLDALGAESASEGEDRRRMRALIAQHLEVLSAMALRSAALRQEKERACEALMQLYRLAAELRSAAAETPASRVTLERLRQACAEASRQITPATATIVPDPAGSEDLPTLPR